MWCKRGRDWLLVYHQKSPQAQQSARLFHQQYRFHTGLYNKSLLLLSFPQWTASRWGTKTSSKSLLNTTVCTSKCESHELLQKHLHVVVGGGGCPFHPTTTSQNMRFRNLRYNGSSYWGSTEKLYTLLLKTLSAFYKRRYNIVYSTYTTKYYNYSKFTVLVDIYNSLT